MAINLEKIKFWVRENVEQIHSDTDVAERFGVSLDTLRKDFLRKERKTLHRFIVETRIEKAKHFLEETDLKCFEICFEVGFGRDDTGAKTFRKVTGFTMQEYRTQHKKKPNLPPS